MGSTRDCLFDVIVHSQDNVLPLGRDFPVPVEHTRRGPARVWGWAGHSGPPGVRQRDPTGDGYPLERKLGTGIGLALLLATGRTAPALVSLDGLGLATLTKGRMMRR